MKKSLPLLAVLLAALIVASVPRAGAAPETPEETALVARGRYIVNSVAMCVQCHTPRDDMGNLNRQKLLQGASIPVTQPPYPGMDWALVAPNIAGLLGYSEEEGIRLLTEGLRRDGTPPRPPMPPFRMTPEDARAVVAYLKSLR